jgi:hypothetical protein
MPKQGLNTHLDNFDFKLWVKLLMNGQGMLNALKNSPQMIYGRNPVVGWNSKEEYDADYSYCIKYVLEDGSNSYVYQRNKIERLSKQQAQKWSEEFNFRFKKQKELNDPVCILRSKAVELGQYGTYSELVKIKKREEKLLEIKSAEIAKYSKLIAKVFDKNIQHYAPLCIIKDRETEFFVNLRNVVPVISDPLKFSDHFDNWQKIGFNLSEVDLKIIKDDKDFDYYMRMIFGDDLIPIIDPLFDNNFQLVSGYPIMDINKEIEKKKNESDE